MNPQELAASGARSATRGTKAKIGLFGIGLAAYWPQFPGLRERLTGYQRELEARIESCGGEVVSGGMVDTPQKARETGKLFARSDLDLVFCYVATYATSSQVLPVVQAARTPVVVLNLQPSAALDYETADTGEWLANCSVCCTPEISNAFERASIELHLVSGMLYDDEKAWREIGEWCRAAAVARSIRESRIGFLGHTYPGMLDMYSDFTVFHARLGVHVEVLEMCDLEKRVRQSSPARVEETLAVTRQIFEIDGSVADSELEWAARVSAGLDALVADFSLNGLTYYYRGLDGNLYERLGAGMILGNSLLTGRGVPASGEGDLKNCLAMMMLDRLGAGGSYTEFYAMDFRENFLLMGHDGPGHLAISDGKPVLRGLGLYHGKRGYGVSVEFKVKKGPVTVLALTQTRDAGLKMIAAEGESLPGPILRIGNTNSRIRFSLPPAEFVNRWCAEAPAHHCALGVGQRMGEISKVAALLGIPLTCIGAG